MSNKKTEIIKDLLMQLENDDWLIRYNAAKILGDIDAEESIHQLLDKLKRENNRDVRRSIVQAIGEIDLNVSIPGLISIMKNDGSAMVRYTAARALGRIGAKEAIPHIKERISKEKNSDSIFWFSLALARLEEDEDGEGVKLIKEMKKKNLLDETQESMFSIVLKKIKEK